MKVIRNDHSEIDSDPNFSGEYDYTTNGEDQSIEHEYDNTLPYDKTKESKSTLTGDYDYDGLYWMPSNEERELMTQFKKLRILNIHQNELK